MKKRLTAKVHGRVHGVSFRYFTRKAAAQLGVSGWVRNERDGSVQLVAEGDQAALEALLNFLHRGPPSADVTQVDATWAESTGEFRSFTIRWL